jgi:CRP-like cAMP-binding protein
MTERSGNLLLDSLDGDVRQSLLERMEVTPMHLRDMLAEPGRPMDRVYFPMDGIISTLTVLGEGGAVEAATVGWEGMAGVEIFLGAGGPDNVQLICQVSGEAYTMEAHEFREATRVDGPFRAIVERYVRTYFVQTTQSAACNGAHSVEERLAKWISLILRWLGRPEFPLTHDFAAAMLGVHRPSVSLAAGALQRAGVIEYRRGQVRVLDADRLREVSCECLAVISRAYDELGSSVRGDGPGAVNRYAAALDRSRAAWRHTRSLHSRAGRLQRESASLATSIRSRRATAASRASAPR